MAYQRPGPDDKQKGNGSGLFSAWIEAEKLMQIALVLPCATFIGWLIGEWLDRHFHQSWIAIVGILFGAASGIYYSIQVAIMANRDPKMQDEDSSGKDSSGPKGGSGGSAQ
ncbi:MAG TPA: AtpZ/AtpI family protein [Terracidiphilus sp.]|nr:AtpZ/AtpI family protein [Terracidiphilus sp.]